MNVTQQALDWLVRLPFLGVFDLSILLDVPENRAAWTLLDLEKHGWVESVRPSSPELEDDLLYFLSAAGAARLAELSGQPELHEAFPIARRDVWRRLATMDIAVGFNNFARRLEDAVWRERGFEIEDVRSLPVSLASERRWWPSGIEGYGSIRWANGSHAPFFIAWDRSGAPYFHRQRCVAGWYAFHDADQPWGHDRIPSILVVCPGYDQLEQWERAVVASADRRQVPPLEVLLATTPEVADVGPLDEVWWRPSSSSAGQLLDLLQWRWAVPDEALSPRLRFPVPKLDALVRTEPSPGQRAWAWDVVSRTQPASKPVSDLERLAAISMLTSKTEKRAVRWLGYHPLLSAADLARLLTLSSEQAADRTIEKLDRFGLVESVQRCASSQDTLENLFYLSELGLKLMAAGDGVPYRRYALHGSVIARVGGDQRLGRLRPLLRQLEHTVGSNRFFVRLIEEADSDGPLVQTWLNEPEARQWVG